MIEGGADTPLFSADKELNPLMWNWNKVYVPYCDGGYFAGQRREPIPVVVTSEDRAGTVKKKIQKNMYHRGRWITEALLDSLLGGHNEKHGHAKMSDATDVVVGGCSSGAISTYLRADFLHGYISRGAPQAFVALLPDSGFYQEVGMYVDPKKYVTALNGHAVGPMTTSSSTAGAESGLLSAQCFVDYGKQGMNHTCAVGSVAARYIVHAPIFGWNSRYDSDQRQVELNATCRADPACVRAYGDTLVATAASFVKAAGDDNASGKAARGFFVDSCDRHCFDKRAASTMPTASAANWNPLQLFTDWYVAAREDGDGVSRLPFSISFEGQFGDAKYSYPCKDCCARQSPSTESGEIDSRAFLDEDAKTEAVVIA